MAHVKHLPLLLLLALPASCGTSDPEAAIRENIAFMQEAVEAKQAGSAVKYLAEHFVGSLGTDKRDLRRILAAQFLQHKKISVAVTRLDIEVNEHNPVTARMDAVIIVTGAEGLLPQNGELINVSGDWELHEGEWLFVSAQWE